MWASVVKEICALLSACFPFAWRKGLSVSTGSSSTNARMTSINSEGHTTPPGIIMCCLSLYWPGNTASISCLTYYNICSLSMHLPENQAPPFMFDDDDALQQPSHTMEMSAVSDVVRREAENDFQGELPLR